MKFILVTPTMTNETTLINTAHIEQIRPNFRGSKIFMARQSEEWGFDIEESFEEILERIKDIS